MSISGTTRSNPDCPICLDPFDPNGHFSVFHTTSDGWKHLVHLACAKSWLQQQTKCPFLLCPGPYEQMDVRLQRLFTKTLVSPRPEESRESNLNELYFWLLNNLRENESFYAPYIAILKNNPEDWFLCDTLVNLAVKIALAQKTFSSFCQHLECVEEKLCLPSLFELLRGALRAGDETRYHHYHQLIAPRKNELPHRTMASLLIEALLPDRFFWIRSLFLTQNQADQFKCLAMANRQVEEKHLNGSLKEDAASMLLEKLLSLAEQLDMVDRRLFQNLGCMSSSLSIEIIVNFCLKHQLTIDNWTLADMLISFIAVKPSSETVSDMFQCLSFGTKETLLRQALVCYVRRIHPNNLREDLLGWLLAYAKNAEISLLADASVLSSHSTVVDMVLEHAHNQREPFFHLQEFSSALLAAIFEKKDSIVSLLLGYNPSEKAACFSEVLRKLFSLKPSNKFPPLSQLLKTMQDLNIDPNEIFDSLSDGDFQSFDVLELALQEDVLPPPSFLARVLSRAILSENKELSSKILAVSDGCTWEILKETARFFLKKPDIFRRCLDRLVELAFDWGFASQVRSLILEERGLLPAMNDWVSTSSTG